MYETLRRFSSYYIFTFRICSIFFRFLLAFLNPEYRDWKWIIFFGFVQWDVCYRVLECCTSFISTIMYRHQWITSQREGVRLRCRTHIRNPFGGTCSLQFILRLLSCSLIFIDWLIWFFLNWKFIVFFAFSIFLVWYYWLFCSKWLFFNPGLCWECLLV